MPRRPPPSALRIVPGPAPPRYVPKHTLPSMPRPTLPAPLKPVRARVPLHEQVLEYDSFSQWRKEERSRGPWDHSGSIVVNIDVERLLPPLKPVVVCG